MSDHAQREREIYTTEDRLNACRERLHELLKRREQLELNAIAPLDPSQPGFPPSGPSSRESQEKSLTTSIEKLHEKIDELEVSE